MFINYFRRSRSYQTVLFLSILAITLLNNGCEKKESKIIDFIMFDNTTLPDTLGLGDSTYTVVLDSNYYQLLKPNGGEVWHEGDTMNITWINGVFDDGYKGYYIYLYYLDIDSVWVSINNGSSIYSWKPEAAGESDENNGYYSWKIPNIFETHDSSLIRIQSGGESSQNLQHNLDNYNGQFVFDVSDAYFTLSADSAHYQITSPNGGEIWTEGSTQNITWETLVINDYNVYLYYSLDGGQTYLAINYTNDDGLYEWQLPTVYITNTQCRIKIRNYTSNSSHYDFYDISDADFTITTAGGSNLITVESPNGGESWHEGDDEFISWSTSGDIGGNKVDIAYSDDAGFSWTEVASSATNDGSYLWTVPSRSDTSTTALIKVSSTNNTTLYDASDNYLTMTSDSNYYRILYPNGGEELQMESNNLIMWESSGDVGNVNLFYSEYAGESWYDISGNESNDGSYIWTVPTLQSDNSNILVKIVDKNNENWFDISDATFSIAQSVTETYDMSFESGESTSGWTFGGNWLIANTDSYSGTKSVECVNPDQADHYLSISKNVNEGIISFYYTMDLYSSEKFIFKIDDVELYNSTTDTDNWVKKEFYINSGLHTFDWIYDGFSVSSGKYIRIDAISFPD